LISISCSFRRIQYVSDGAACDEQPARCVLISALVAVEAWLLSTNQGAAIPARPGRPTHPRKQSWKQSGEGGEDNGTLCPPRLGGGDDDDDDDDDETMA
ncbi:hypothetical protein FQN60_014344, partial [Etheostoma spectabile]